MGKWEYSMGVNRDPEKVAEGMFENCFIPQPIFSEIQSELTHLANTWSDTGCGHKKFGSPPAVLGQSLGEKDS